MSNHYEKVIEDLYLHGFNPPGWYGKYQKAWQDGFELAIKRAKEIKKDNREKMESIITFKSTPCNWQKELDGIKRNTFRFTDDWTEERWNKFNNATHVGIKRTTDSKTFYRPITDKTIYNNVVIISW